VTAMTWVIRFCALYNAGAIVMFLVPGMLGLVGAREPYSPFWRWLPATMAMFPTIVLWISAQDLRRYGPFPFYNGLIRLTFAVAAIALDFGATAGAFLGLLAWGDLVLALIEIVGIPVVLKCSPVDLLLNRVEPVG
jgi:hypothetical protein